VPQRRPHPERHPHAGDLPMPTRRHILTAALPAAALLLGACAGSSLPAVQWVRLPAEAPGPAAAPAPAAPGVWQLMAPVQLPGHLDRDALLVPQGAAGLQGLGGARWAEPLRDAVPRLLRQDLEREFGAPVWTAPLPPGVLPGSSPSTQPSMAGLSLQNSTTLAPGCSHAGASGSRNQCRYPFESGARSST